MKVSLNWLKAYVDFDLSAQELADRLTMAGVPVATVHDLGKSLDRVVVGQLVQVEKHPNADRLLICQVNVGEGTVTIVTGAQNVKAGDKVPVARVGAVLPTGMKITEAKLRGIASYGMLCSAEELQLDAKTLPPEQREGIYILPAHVQPGTDVKKVLGLDDVVLEFELTANRADCFCALGIAREVAVLTGGRCNRPLLSLQERGVGDAGELATVQVEEPELCTRFTARILQKVKIGPSPEWMQQRLKAAGMRAINNIVDATNYVMLEMGQPMHAYDYNLLGKKQIVVRKARPGETLTTLDGNRRELTPDMLVIADAVQAVGVAGVMGGLATEVTEATNTVLLEAAAFQPASVRRTGRQLGLRSEASGRFEKGVDEARVAAALDRCAQLLEEMGACVVCPGVIDVNSGRANAAMLTVSADRINAYLGTDIAADVMQDILTRLEFQVTVDGKGMLAIGVPSWRRDVEGEADIAEEVGRIYGYNKIPSTLPAGTAAQMEETLTQQVARRIRGVMVAAGYYEVINFSFAHPDVFDKLKLPAEDLRRRAIPLMNPITDDFPLLRTELLGSMLETIVRNTARKNEDLRLFELGTTYLSKQLPLRDLPEEPQYLCAAITGRRCEKSWNQTNEAVDFYDAKGAVELILEALGIADYQVVPGTHPALHPGKTAVFQKNNQVLAMVGEVHPEVQAGFGLKKKVYIIEIPLQALVEVVALLPRYRQLPKFPAVERDLAFVADAQVPAAALQEEILSQGGTLLESVNLFDVFQSEQLGDGKRSLAFALVFRATDRTLTDEEVDAVCQRMIQEVAEKWQAKIRS